MNIRSATNPDELLLAQLACAKLAKLLQGALSVGFAALELNHFEHFLKERERVLSAFAVVISKLPIGPGFPEMTQFWVSQSGGLSRGLTDFFQAFTRLGECRSLTKQLLMAAEELNSAYAVTLQALQTLTGFLEMELDLQQQKQIGSEMINDFISLCVDPEKTTVTTS